jgi:hypothetical protein
MNDRELTRLADIAAAARPDWNHRSIRAFLAKNLATRAYADVAIAMMCVAMDEQNQTLRLLLEHGPWWQAVATATRQQTQTPGPGRESACDRVGHEHELARNCRACAAERLAETEIDATPMQPAPPPVEITAVAERHRRVTPKSDRRDFAQPEELKPVDGRGGASCARCQAYFIDDLDGRESHQIVFGHPPVVPPPVPVSVEVVSEVRA